MIPDAPEGLKAGASKVPSAMGTASASGPWRPEVVSWPMREGAGDRSFPPVGPPRLSKRPLNADAASALWRAVAEQHRSTGQ